MKKTALILVPAFLLTLSAISAQASSAASGVYLGEAPSTDTEIVCGGCLYEKDNTITCQSLTLAIDCAKNNPTIQDVTVKSFLVGFTANYSISTHNGKRYLRKSN